MQAGNSERQMEVEGMKDVRWVARLYTVHGWLEDVTGLNL